MRSKTSFFDRTIFLNAIKRFWPIWFAYAFFWLIFLPISMWSQLGNAFTSAHPEDRIRYVAECMPVDFATSAGLTVSVIFGIAAAMAVFSYMYFQKSSGAMASLPIRRESMFVSLTLAGILPMLLINLAVFLICLGVGAAYGVSVVSGLAQWLAIMSMLDVFFFGFAVLCAQLTGNIVILPLVYVVLNFAVAVLEYVTRLVFGIFIYGYAYEGFALDFLSPIISILDGCYVEYVQRYSPELEYYVTTAYIFHGWGRLIAYCVVGLILLALALILHKKRRMESVGDVVAIRVLKPVFKVCMAVGCALCFALLVFSIPFSTSDGTVGYALIFAGLLLVGCMLGYFAAQMLVQKSFRVFRCAKSWLSAAIIFAVLVAALFSSEFDLFGYERKIPQREEIKSVTLGSFGEPIKLVEDENIEAVLALHGKIIDNKPLHDNGNRWVQAYFSYELTNGSKIMREYYLAAVEDGAPDDWQLMQDILNSEEAINRRKELEFPITEENISYASVDYTFIDGDGVLASEALRLSAADANELYYTCIVPDMAEQKLGRVWLVTGDDYMTNVYNCHISIDIMEQAPDGKRLYEYFYTVPSLYSTRTNAWLTAHGVTLATVAETSTYSYNAEYAVGSTTSSSTIITRRG